MTDIHVYVIDDEDYCVEEVVQEVAWERLGIDPSKVHGATSTRAARRIIDKEKPGIFICDVEMPGESGLEFMEWITEWARFNVSPHVAIMLTCHLEYQFIRRALQLGCMDYVLKPADMSELEAVIEKAVRNILDNLKKQNIISGLAVPDVHEDAVNGKIIPYILANLRKSFSVEDIAREVGLNPQYMMRMFKKATGMSVLQFVTSRRIDLAREYLVRTDYSIERITEEVGYFSVAHFNQIFKKAEGISPGQYRRQYRKV